MIASNREKTGLAGRIREFMKSQIRPVNRAAIYEGLGLVGCIERQQAYTAVGDFIKRGEIARTPTGRLKYNRKWRRADKSPLRDKILKAMYISSNFTNADIRKLVEGAGKSYVGKLIQRLLDDGELYQTGQQICTNGGIERMFNVSDRVRFRTEVMR